MGPFVEGQQRYLVEVCCKIQGLVRGHLARNAFYYMMIDKKYKPVNEDMRKRLIGFKLGLIGKKQTDYIERFRLDADKSLKDSGQNVKITEKLIESYYPNIARAMMERS